MFPLIGNFSMSSQIDAATALEYAVANICSKDCVGNPDAWRGDGIRLIELLERDGWTVTPVESTGGRLFRPVIRNTEDDLRRRSIGRWALIVIGVTILVDLAIYLLAHSHS
jgi:hypothetical protein